ncbi:glycosyltransferase [Scytonema sp. UIC 10036]|uniref:glycosyltransferase n=1 Tax=Scytonema sp. UIC 10036 TaxID=2304196 RepID=UPI0012DA6F05|nr:glycosyltransferase family 2 protein [Scytonema sp. UIC 10036]MUG96450.1 glycosyltransferase [Scytonema sp. UIC 10036]
MKELAILLSRNLLGWAAVQTFFTLLFISYLRSSRKNSLPDEQLPKTAVVLCLRGADPFLPNCLQALLNQNYPQYDIKIIIDSPEDPAWDIVTDSIYTQAANKVQISPLRVPRDNCSLKCSSLIQAVSDLDDSYKVVTFVDADAVVHPNWLRELVSPLSHPKIGATTGNRWYLPTGRYWGSLVRYIWNISAVLQMSLYRIAWGGSLAIKRELIHETGLLEKWGQAYGEDTMIRNVLAKHGKQVKFVPSVLILNREECDLPKLFGWLKRQFLASRLYHPWWWAVVADSISTILVPNLLLVIFLAAFWTKQWITAAFCLASFSIYTMTLLLLAIALEKEVQQILRHYNPVTTELSAATVLKMLVAIPLTQWVSGLAMVIALGMRRVNWRGVTYRIKGPWDISLVEYHPYQLCDKFGDSKVSI